MASQNYLTFFALFFFVYSLSTTTTLASPKPVIFDIRNDLPNNVAGDLALRCGQDATSHPKIGEHYKRSFKVDQSLECNAQWTRFFLTWDGYQEKRDGGHSTIYWSVRKDGFYHSFDASNWIRLETWETD